MNKLKQILKFYPDKSKRPNLHGLLIGAAYDFGWLFVIILGGSIYTIFRSQAPEILSANLKFSATVLAVSIVQIVILETVLWWLFYFFKKKKINVICDLDRIF